MQASSPTSVPSDRLFALILSFVGSSDKQEELAAVKQNLADFENCKDKVTAAAFGYLLAKQEQDTGETKPSERFHPLYYQLLGTINEDETILSSEEKVEQVLELVDDFLAKVHESKGYDRLRYRVTIAGKAMMEHFPFLRTD